MIKVTFLIGHLVKERDLILYELAESLSKHGAKVTVVSGYPSRRITKEVRKKYENSNCDIINDNFINYRVGSKSGEGTNLFTRMLKYIALTFCIYKKAKTIDADVVYIYSTPPFLGYLSYMFHGKTKVLYNAQDLFPDSLKVALSIKENNCLIKLFRYLEKKVYECSDVVVTISEDMKHTISSNGCDINKIKVISNWADIDNIKPINKEHNKLYDEFNIRKDRFTVLYAGDIGMHQHLDVFLDTAKLLKDYKDIQFVFFGNGAYKTRIKEKIDEYKLNNFYLYPLQPIERISLVYSLGDLDIVSLEKGMTKMALPSKVMSIMAAGRPVLGKFDKNSELAKLIDSKYGIVVDTEDPIVLKQILIKAAKNRIVFETMGKHAREYAVQNFSREIQTKKYFDQIQRVIYYEN